MFASACRRLISANAARFFSSRRNSCTTAIPDRFSCRNALIRATHRRVSRNERRCALAEPVRHREEEGDDGERDEGEPPVEAHHDGHDPDEGEEVAEDGDDPGGEELVDGVDVGRHAGHEPTHRVAVEVGDVQPLQVAEDLAAHVLHDPLPGHLHEAGLQVAHPPRRHEREEEEERDPAQRGGVAPRDAAVDRDLREVRRDEIERGRRDDEDERHRDGARVRAKVVEQAPQERPVVRLRASASSSAGRAAVLTPRPRRSRSPPRGAAGGGGRRRSRRGRRARRASPSRRRGRRGGRR